MSARDDKDADEGGTRTRVAKLWDDPTTEDEVETATKIVDARPMLEKLKALTAKESARPATDSELTPAVGKEAARALTDLEHTPAVGVALPLIRSTLERTGSGPAPLISDEGEAPSIEVDEVALTDEERMAIAADDVEDESTVDGGEDLLGRLRQCLEQGDPVGVVREAEAILARNPDDLEAEAYLASGREALVRKYREVLGDFRNIPKLGVPAARMTSQDHRAAFIVSLIDGAMTIDEILDISAMPAFEALRTLCELLEDGSILLQPPSVRSQRRP